MVRQMSKRQLLYCISCISNRLYLVPVQLREQEVGGSNPPAPTNITTATRKGCGLLSICKLSVVDVYWLLLRPGQYGIRSLTGVRFLLDNSRETEYLFPMPIANGVRHRMD